MMSLPFCTTTHKLTENTRTPWPGEEVKFSFKKINKKNQILFRAQQSKPKYECSSPHPPHTQAFHLLSRIDFLTNFPALVCFFYFLFCSVSLNLNFFMFTRILWQGKKII